MSDESLVPSRELHGAELLALAVLEANRMIAERDAALALAKPKIEGFNALMASDQTMSITDAAKHFGVHPKLEVFPYLREHGYLTLRDLPTMDAIDAGYLVLLEDKCRDGEVRRRAAVQASQLETWRTRVIPQIKRWIGTI